MSLGESRAGRPTGVIGSTAECRTASLGGFEGGRGHPSPAPMSYVGYALGHLTVLRASPANALEAALETNASAVQVLGYETLREIARELVAGTDRTFRENVRANLRRHGYPPDKRRTRRGPCSNKVWHCRRGGRGGAGPKETTLWGREIVRLRVASFPSSPATSSAAIPFGPTKSRSCLHIGSGTRHVVMNRNPLYRCRL